MNTSFERSANASDEWYTPREIIEAFGEFDLCSHAPSLAYRKNHVQQAGQWSYTKWGGGEFGLTLRTPNRLYGSL